MLILGEGNERKNLESLIKTLKLENKVFLMGKRDNIEDYYRQCEFFILPSKYEGFPNVLVEALANGCACISTDCPTGPNEIIKNEVNGLLIENDNQKAMTKAIDRLFFDKKLKYMLKNNAKKSILHLKLENIAEEWLKI